MGIGEANGKKHFPFLERDNISAQDGRALKAYCANRIFSLVGGDSIGSLDWRLFIGASLEWKYWLNA